MNLTILLSLALINESADDIDWKSIMSRFGPQNDADYNRDKLIKNALIITLYAIIFVISLFGNLLVCYVVCSKKQMKTVTNNLILNLTVSDIMMTLVNIPFNIARIMLDDWPFGELLCKLVPFVQTVSVYVSTVTMCVIAMDRYQAIINPLGTRLSAAIPMHIIIATIWLVSAVFSVPHMYYNQVLQFDVLSYKSMVRCRVNFPEPRLLYSRSLTVLAFTTQYLIPLSIASIAYIKISCRIYRRGHLGAMTQQQMVNNARSNRKTIKMLIIVLIVFAICWLPLNLYHIRVDFGSEPSSGHNSSLWLGVHWLAMSSVCYNPFIYSIRNSNFRHEIRNLVRYLCCQCQPGSGSAGHSVGSIRERDPGSTTARSLVTTQGQLCSSCVGNGSRNNRYVFRGYNGFNYEYGSALRV